MGENHALIIYGIEINMDQLKIVNGAKQFLNEITTSVNLADNEAGRFKLTILNLSSDSLNYAMSSQMVEPSVNPVIEKQKLTDGQRIGIDQAVFDF